MIESAASSRGVLSCTGRRGCGQAFVRPRLALIFALLSGLAILAPAPSNAGDFSITWGTAPFTWTAGATGPVTFTATDQYGFQIQARIGVTRIGGAAVAGYPDDLSGFGTQTSLWLVWDANNGSSGIGEATNTATLEILSGGSPLATNGIAFRVPDIDSTDNNNASDRCDFVTLTGNAGNPALTYVGGTPATRSVIIGPGTGSGATGAIAANQAQCVYNTGATTSPTSSGDDLGTILATYPTGTHTATVAYDESIENVYGVTSRNAAARGTGVFSAGVVTVSNSITLDKTTTATSYTAVGQVIPYTYTITNNGPLPIRTAQNIQVQDSKVGLISCGSPASAVPAGGTFVCTANYTVTAADVAAPAGITNTAIAGVGTGAQAFATRLQSNSDAVTLPNRVVDAVNDNFSGTPVPGSGGATATVFSNDTLGAASFAASAVNATLLSNGGLTGAVLNADGTITVPGGAAAGSYTLQYRICDAAAPAVCDTANAIVAVAATPSFSIVKAQTSGPNPVTAAGQSIGYTITVDNTGNVALTAPVLTDALVQGASPRTLTSGPAYLSGDTDTDSVLDITETWTYAAAYTVTLADLDNGGTFSNTATFDTAQTTPSTSAAVTTPVTQAPAMTITKVADGTSLAGNVPAGHVVTYTYTVANTGNVTISGVSVTDVHGGSGAAPTPGNETGVIVANGSTDGVANGSWDTLRPGDTIAFTGTYTVTQTDVDTLQ